MGHWKNRWIQTPQRKLMDPCIKQAPVWSKWFWIILWPLAYNRLELDSIRKIINFWYTFGWKWRVFVTIWDCRTHVRMTSMTSSVERTDLDFKISVALPPTPQCSLGKSAWMDGRTLKRFGGYNIIPRHFLWLGIKSNHLFLSLTLDAGGFGQQPTNFHSWRISSTLEMNLKYKKNWLSRSTTKPTKWPASAQSDQSLCCALPG